MRLDLGCLDFKSVGELGEDAGLVVFKSAGHERVVKIVPVVVEGVLERALLLVDPLEVFELLLLLEEGRLVDEGALCLGEELRLVLVLHLK